MKKILLLVIFGLSIACGKMNAQSLEFIFPQYKEFIGYYYSPAYSGSILYNYGDIKVKVNTTIEFDISSSSFWNGCTNFTWHLNLPSGASTVYGKNQRVKPTNAGWAYITIDAIDRDGVRHRNCSFAMEVVN